MVKPTVVFGSGTWAMNEKDMKRLGTLERKILRRIHGPVIKQGIWRRGNSKGLGEQDEDTDIVADIKKKSLERIGYVERIDQGRRVKGVFESKSEGRRSRRLRWLEGVEKDPQEMNVNRWRQKAVDREEWVSVIKEAKVLRGPKSQGVSR